MQRLTYVNARGVSVTFDSGAPYVFWKISGLELPPVEPVTTQGAGQHGYTVHNILLDSRIVRLTGHVHGKGDDGIRRMYEARRRLQEICNPVLGIGKLIYENDSGTWAISAFCSTISYGNKIRELHTLDVQFECPSPFWLTEQPSIVRLAYVEGGLEFPLEFPGFFGTLGYRVEVDNTGGSVVPLEMTLDGGAVNPVITNKTTGEFIKMAKQLMETDKLYINTDPEKTAVRLITIDPETNNEVSNNAFGYLSDDSTLFSLVPGINELTFTSDDENKKVSIKITFHIRFLGV